MLTTVDDTEYTELLKGIYCSLYLEYVSRNPMYEKDSIITYSIFKEKLRELIKNYLS